MPNRHTVPLLYRTLAVEYLFVSIGQFDAALDKRLLGNRHLDVWLARCPLRIASLTLCRNDLIFSHLDRMADADFQARDQPP